MTFAEPIRSGYHDSVRYDVVPSIPRRAGNLVDIGGGVGATAGHLRAQNIAARAGVIDLVPCDDSRLDFAHGGDLEDQAFLAPVLAKEGPFDTVLCLDILEHLRDPWALVALLHRHLEPGGVIVASVPNVRHVRVSGGLFFRGRWDLTDGGILDRTHLRFFVRSTAIELLTHSGLTLVSVEAAASPRHPRLAAGVRALTRGWLNSLVDLQYIITVRRGRDAGPVTDGGVPSR